MDIGLVETQAVVFHFGLPPIRDIVGEPLPLHLQPILEERGEKICSGLGALRNPKTTSSKVSLLLKAGVGVCMRYTR